MTQPQALPSETGRWWALAIRGAIAIIFGLAALLRPDIALEAGSWGYCSPCLPWLS